METVTDVKRRGKSAIKKGATSHRVIRANRSKDNKKPGNKKPGSDIKYFFLIMVLYFCQDAGFFFNKGNGVVLEFHPYLMDILKPPPQNVLG